MFIKGGDNRLLNVIEVKSSINRDFDFCHNHPALRSREEYASDSLLPQSVKSFLPECDWRWDVRASAWMVGRFTVKHGRVYVKLGFKDIINK